MFRTGGFVNVVAMSTIHEVDLPFVDLFAPDFVETFHDHNAEARARSPIVMTALGPTVLTERHVRGLLRDPRLRQHAIQQSLEAQGEPLDGEFARRELRTLISLDGADHSRLRRLVAPVFSPAAADRLRPVMREIIGELAESVDERGRCDAVTEIARPYPIPVICALVGAPRADWDDIGTWAADILRIFDYSLATDRDRITAAHDAFEAYIARLLDERSDEPGDDLVSMLLAAEADGDRLTHDELTMIVEASLVGGSDTTRHQLALAIWAFAQHPDQWEDLAADPTLVPAAVGESLRWYSTAGVTVRLAIEDVDVDGIVIPAGTSVLLSMEAANRDPAVHHEPDRFDIHRSGEATTLAFGGGPHHCLGAALARAELEEALAALSSRWTDLRLDGPISWTPGLGLLSLATLPIAFDRRT